MQRAFFIGLLIGLLVFIQGALVLRGHSGPFTPLDLWALSCTGVFGLMLSSSPQGLVSFATAGIALGLFYGLATMLVALGYRSWRFIGAVGAFLLVVVIHAMLYLWVVRSVVA